MWSLLRPWFDGFVSAVALLTGMYTFYKNFVQRAKLSIVPGDRIAVVRGPGGSRRIHVRGVLLNDATKMGTLQYLEARITAPNEAIQRYSWNELIEFVPGTAGVQRSGPPLPIAVPGKDSRLLQAQLEIIEQDTPSRWIEGRHRIEVVGWVGRESRAKRPNVRCVFHVHITSEQASAFILDQTDFAYEDVPIEEWRS